MNFIGRKTHRILFFSVATHLGGAERCLLSLVSVLKQRPELGYCPQVLVPKEEGALVQELRSMDVPYRVLQIPPGFFRMSRSRPLEALGRGILFAPQLCAYFLKFSALLQQEEISLIHSNGIKCHALSGLLRSYKNVPVLWHLHDILSNGFGFQILRSLKHFNRIHVLCNSYATAKAFSPKLDDSISVIYNALDPKIYYPAPHRDFHQRFGLDPQIQLIGLLGVLARWKGHVEFLKMAQHLISGGVKVHFVIIGGEIYDTDSDRGLSEFLKAEAITLGIQDQVHFLGFQSNPAHVINGLDLLVHASIRPEPFGRVVLEAMACGVPVVASAAGGILEFVKHEATGLLYQPGNIQEMAQAVNRLLLDAALRARLVAGARAEFLANFTLEKHVHAVAKLYDEIISR